MTEGMRWRKAVAISLLLHGIMLMSIGWLAARAVTLQDTSEPYLELTLVSDWSGSDNMPAGSAADLVTVPDRPVVRPLRVPEPVAAPSVQEEAAVVATAASSMSILSADTGSEAAIPAVSGGSAGSGSTEGSGGTGAGAGSAVRPGRGGGIIAPGILSKVEPDYPERARQDGQEGTVVLKIQIVTNGRPEQVTVYRSSGYELLDEAAVTAVQRWRFVPAQDRATGQNVACYTTLPVVFKLKT